MKHLILWALLISPMSYGQQDLHHNIISYEMLMSLNGNPYDVASTLSLSGEKGNGGDLCENKVQEVASDIKRWINEGGHLALIFESEVNAHAYQEKMLAAIESSSITCIDKVITVSDKEKTCVNFENSDGENLIVCQRQKLAVSNINDQYRLIHHELAGIARLESGSAAGESRYHLSNQITAFLEKEIVTKLAVKEPKVAFSQTDKASAYRLLARCANDNSSDDIVKILNYATTFAKRERVELEEMVREINKISCIYYNDPTIKVLKDIFHYGDLLSTFAYIDLFFELRKSMSSNIPEKHLASVVLYSYPFVLKAINVGGNKEDAITSLLDILATVKADKDSFFSDAKPKYVDALNVYSMIWELD